ncbi:MAG: carbohydrate ABC transporter permease [Clostridiales bacterium]|jgi:multiple sugar transport system permease protein|nr:carbohydrate ABC transporter permease [Clostridiales bacterium]
MRDAKFGRTAGKVVVYVLLISFALLLMVPFYWMVQSSLKLDQDVFTIPIQWWPANPVWENYINIWTRIPLMTFLGNTARLTVIVTFLQLLTSSFAAYAFSKLRFRGRNLLFLLYVGTIAVPWQVYMVPQFIMFRTMGLVDTHMAIIVLQAFTAFGVFLMKQFYDTIPYELNEAARIDGMSEYQIWRQIMLPLSKPALATLTIFTFVFTWNDFLGPRLYLVTQNLWTIQIGMRMFIGQHATEFGLIMAIATVSLIPILIVFLSLQRFFVQGIATTGLKG